MTVVHGDILRGVQYLTLIDGQRVSNKFYWVAELETVVPIDDVLDAVETWVAYVYQAVRNVCSEDILMSDGVLDRISWIGGAWRTMSRLGMIDPDPDWNNDTPWVPDQVAALVVFTTASRKMRRPFYLPGLTMDRLNAGLMNGYAFGRVAILGARALEPVDLSPAGALYPVTVHASQDGLERLTGCQLTNVVTALHRRRPTA